MAQIHNSDLIKGLSKNAGIQTSFENPPNQLAEKVVPTMESNPEMLRRSNIVRWALSNNSSSGATIYTTPTDRDFYLVGCQLHVIKDVTATSLRSYIQVKIDGADQQILVVSGLTLTVQDQSVAISFPFPVKVDRGVAIKVFNSTAVGNVTSDGAIIGYVVDASNA